MTSKLTTDLNVVPYTDDFDEDKQFHRILFRPSYAVQARELTQIQTQLQDQIGKFANHLFKDGTFVQGGEISYDSLYSFVKLQDRDEDGSLIDISNFSGLKVTGQTSGVQAVVINTASGSQAASPDTNTLFVKYLDSGSNNTTQTFQSGEQLVANSGSFTANVITSGTVTGHGSAVTVNTGIFYAKGNFIKTTRQTLILDKYTNTPSYRVGFSVNESIITPEDDTSLLDPATGVHNENAPGAHRLKLNPVLTKRAVANTNLQNFYQIFQIENGTIKVRGDRTQYSELKKELARRTYDESGDYAVNPMKVRVREHLNDGTNLGLYTEANGGDENKLAIGIEAGKVVVRGFDYETLSTTYLAVNKGTDTKEVEAQAIPANYGNYVTVNEVAGPWNPDDLTAVSLRSSAGNAVSNGTFGSTAAVGTEIGTARVRDIVYSSGTAGSASAEYRLYLFDIKMQSGYSFANTRSFRVNNSSLADAYADAVLTSGAATLNETSFNQLVFEIPQSAIKTLRDSGGNIDNNFQFIKDFAVTIDTAGQFTLDTGAADEVLPFSTGLLNSTQKNTNFYLTLREAAEATLTGTANTVSNTVNGFSTNFTGENLAADQYIKIGSNGPYRIHSVTDANTLVLTSQPGVTGAAQSITKYLHDGLVINMSGTGTGGSRTVNVTGTTTAAFDIQETLSATTDAAVRAYLQKTDGREVSKTLKSGRYVLIRANTHYANTTGPWGLGFSDIFEIQEVRQKSSAFASVSEGTDVTQHFELDTGQRDNVYEHGRLKKKAASTLSIGTNDELLVKVSYFTHDTSQGIGYLSVDSYPTDDANTANTTAITTQEIPIFISPTTGEQYDLRNSIDLRPIKTNTSTDSTTLGSATTNPANSSAMTVPSGGQHLIPANESFTTDLEYYLPRIDKVVIDSEGTFRILTGVSDLDPKEPGDLENAMTLAVVTIPPYPSLAPNVGRDIERPDLTTQIDQVDNRRFTMRDIGAIEQRVNNLEYYQALSLLEKDAADLNIVDSSGLNRFKNGILVDGFTGHNIGDITNPDYKASIDTEGRALRPPFDATQIDLTISGSSTNIVRAANDTVLTLISTTGEFSNNETVFQGASLATASARGKLLFVANSARMYVTNRQGTFSTGSTVKGDSSGAVASLSAVTNQASGDLVTLPFSHTEYLDQPYASKARNLILDNQYTWEGDIDLDPDNDTAADTTTKPDIDVNYDNNYDGWIRLGRIWRFHWLWWLYAWAGLRRKRDTITSDTTRTFTINRRGIRRAVRVDNLPKTQWKTLSFGRYIDLNILPYCRGRKICVTARNLKPNTRVWAFFDGEDVNSYVAPANSSFANTASEGSSLTTDSSGTLYACFRLPDTGALRFRAGIKRFQLIDMSDISMANSATTSAKADYVASGSQETVQGTIDSTRKAGKLDDTPADFIGERRFIDGTSRVTDPLSQTFYVREPAGIFLTKADIYFKAKHSTLPVTIEIREAVNGFPGDKVVPFSRVTVNSSSVNVSSDASLPTPFTFKSPVYLKPEQEYALVIRPAGNNPDYSVWVSELGGTDITNSTVKISKQSATGQLFAASNDRTWTPLPQEDLKFTLHRASFNTALTGTVLLTNKNEEYFQVSNVSGTFVTTESVHGEVRLTLTGNTATLNNGEDVVGFTSGARGTITDVTSLTVRLKDVSANTKFTDGESVYFISGASNTGANATISTQTTPTGTLNLFDNVDTDDIKLYLTDTTGTWANGEQLKGQQSSATALVSSVDVLQLNTLYSLIQSLAVTDTNIDWGAKTTSSANALDSTFTDIPVNENFDFSTERRVLGRNVETTSLSGSKSFQLRGQMTTSRSQVSPVVDLKRIGATITGNDINNVETGETGNGGSAKAKYITRRVTLDDGQDAEDLKVYLDAYKPSGTDVSVYYRILNAEDDDLFEERDWVEMTQVTSASIVSDSEATDDFIEYEYDIPDVNKTGSNGEVQYTNSTGATMTGFKVFAIKIVLTSSNTAKIPRVKDLRVIALQV